MNLFGNRFFWWKIGLCAVVVFAGFAWSGRRGIELHPLVTECLLRPDLHDGAHLWLHRATITGISHDGFTVIRHGVPVFVKGGPVEYPVGTEVSLTGWFRKGPQGIPCHLELDRIEPLWFPDQIRSIMETISVAVLILVLVRFVRLFRLNPSFFGRRG